LLRNEELYELRALISEINREYDEVFASYAFSSYKDKAMHERLAELDYARTNLGDKVMSIRNEVRSNVLAA
jgi:hypothetical protein